MKALKRAPIGKAASRTRSRLKVNCPIHFQFITAIVVRPLRFDTHVSLCSPMLPVAPKRRTPGVRGRSPCISSQVSRMQPMRRWPLLIGVIVLVLLAAIRLIIGDPQRENMEKARLHAPKVTAVLRADPRFADVQATEFSGLGGSLGIHGYVATEASLQDLKRLVEATYPPVKVAWLVHVFPTTDSALPESMPASRPTDATSGGTQRPRD